jgi:hypothetical protein
MRGQVAARENAIMNLRVPKKYGEFLGKLKAFRFSRRALLHGVSKSIYNLYITGTALMI